MKKTFPSRVDVWMLAILSGIPLVLVGLGAAAFSRSSAAGLFQMVLGLGVGVLIFLFSRPCLYTLGEESLVIKSGLWEEELPLARIHSAELCIGFLNAPALSVRRVRLVLDDGQQRCISPLDREGFLRELAARRKA